MSENWSVATTKEQLFSPVGKYIFHVTTPQRAEKIMKTGLKPSKKSKGKFKGYAYRCKTIQPKGYLPEIVTVEEFKLKEKSC